MELNHRNKLIENTNMAYLYEIRNTQTILLNRSLYVYCCIELRARGISNKKDKCNMVKMRKLNMPDTELIYTHFLFDKYQEWDDFDCILNILVKELNCHVIEQGDYIWSRRAQLDLEGFKFVLLYHEDWDVILHNPDKQDDEYYDKLESIASRVALKLPDR